LLQLLPGNYYILSLIVNGKMDWLTEWGVYSIVDWVEVTKPNSSDRCCGGQCRTLRKNLNMEFYVDWI